MGLLSVKFRLALLIRKRKWRKLNKHNETFMLNDFNVNQVIVGDKSYGNIKVIMHEEKSKLIIGNYCSIAPEVTFLLSGEHSLDKISTYPFKTKIIGNSNQDAFSKGNIIIEDDVWIGFGSIIMSGITIKQGAVIAAGSIVTKNVEAYEVVGGVPATHIKYRFSNDIIKELLKVDFDSLTDNLIYENIEKLYEKLKYKKQLNWLPKKEQEND